MERRETTRVFCDAQGNYSWVYRLPMFKNFSILYTVLKAIGICFIPIVGLFIYIMAKKGFRSSSEELVILLIIAGALLVISVGCYFAVAAIYGGNYIAYYYMDDEMITLSQPSDQQEKNRMIGLFTAAAGTLSGNPGVAAAGLSAPGMSIAQTKFSKILSLKLIKNKGEIRVHSFMTWYTVYVNEVDFNMVAEHMAERSVKARIVRKY